MKFMPLPNDTANFSGTLVAAACGDTSAVHEKREAEFRPLRMDWVVVTDTNGNRRPEIGWRVN
jgi:hypothetical protein